jgi:hypothetical protein
LAKGSPAPQEVPSRKLFNAFKEKSKPRGRPAWTPREDEPALDFCEDDDLERLVSADLERELERGIQKSMVLTKNPKTKDPKAASKVLLPRLEGLKSMKDIDNEMSL